MKVIVYALAAVLAVPSTLGQHHTHTRRLGVVNEQAAMSIDMITDAMSMQSTAAVEPNEDPVYPVFGKSGKSGGHGGPTPPPSTTSGKSGKSGSGPTAPSAPGSGKGGKSGPTAPSDGSSKSGKSATTTQATSPGTTGGTTSGTDPTTPDTSSTVMTSSGTTSGTDPTTPDATVMTTDATTPVTPTPPDTTVMTTDATTPGTPTPPDTTVMTTSPPPAGECTINSSGPLFSNCPGTMSKNFCCTPTNPDGGQGPTTCVNKIDGKPCGPGPAQLDMCETPNAQPNQTPCDPANQQCCKDSNTNQNFCCLPDLEPIGLTCLSIPSGYCDLPEVFRDNGLAVFLLGLILQALGLFDGNRRNLRSVVDEQGIQDIVAKFASLLDEEEGGMEGIMAKVADLGVDADMMNQLVNVIGN